MESFHIISARPLNIQTINDVFSSDKKLKLSDASQKKIVECREYLDDKLNSMDVPIYGINTGFGSLHNVKISEENLTKLQENLMRSHACGLGDTVPNEIVKLMLWFKVRSLSYGKSGVQLQTVNRLIEFYNNGVYPVVYTQGSLGASGDLAPLAHLSLPLIGEGEVWFENKIVSTQEVFNQFDWQPIKLKSKEGLALLNGTQFMSAYGIYNLLESYKLSYIADLVASISLDAFDGRIEPFNDLVHYVRPHNGQIRTAQRVREFLEGSEIIIQEKQHVQDPYSFRCVPQVHGATKDTLDFVLKTFITEINGVTDNPSIFVDEDEIISGGNFHGQPLALALDYLKIAMAELGNISERRIFQLVSGLRGLPEFLVNNPGLNSGLMIPQYTAASIVSANKQLATPASVDSIVSSNGQEDHVSMGANAAVQAYLIIDNIYSVLAIELFNASQAMSFRLPLKTSRFLQEILLAFQDDVELVEEDKFLRDNLVKSVRFLKCLSVENQVLFF